MLLLLLIYCCGVGIAGRTLHIPEVELFSEGTYFSTAKNSMFFHVPQEETSLAKVNELPVLVPISPVGALLALQSHNLLVLATIRQYDGHWANLLIRHRKANLIFPFHSFW